MEKTQHRPGDCSGRGFATQIEAHGLENELPAPTWTAETSKMSLPCRRHAEFRKHTRSRSKLDFKPKMISSAPPKVEKRPGDSLHNPRGQLAQCEGALLITAQPSKSHFQRDRCVFRKSACRLHGKLISEVVAIHLDAKTSPRAISGTVLVFVPMFNCQHRPRDCCGRGFGTQIEAHGFENELPV